MDVCSTGVAWLTCVPLEWLVVVCLGRHVDCERFCNYQDKRKLFAALHRYLKPAGRLLLSDFTT